MTISPSNWTPLSAPSLVSPNGAPHDLSLILGRLLERSETALSVQHETRADISQIKTRLAEGNHVFRDLVRRVSRLEAKRREAEAQADDPPGPVERWIKYLLPFLFPLTVLWSTGSLDLAFRAAGLGK